MPAEGQRGKSSRGSWATLSLSSPAPSQVPIWGYNCPESPSAPTELVSKEFPPIPLDPEGLQSNSINGGEAFQIHRVLRGLTGEGSGARGHPGHGDWVGERGRSWGCARQVWRPASSRDSCTGCPGTEAQEWAVRLLAEAPAISGPLRPSCRWPHSTLRGGGEQRRVMHAQVPTHHGVDGRGSGAELGLRGLRSLGSGPRK